MPQPFISADRLRRPLNLHVGHSMRADFLVADLDAAKAYDSFLRANTLRPVLVDVFETGNLTSVEITTLWAILEGVEWNANRHFFPELLADGEGKTWLHELPTALVQLLATLEEDSIQDTVREWSLTEELMCSPLDLVPGLQELSRLARVATGARTSMFLWGAV